MSETQKVAIPRSSLEFVFHVNTFDVVVVVAFGIFLLSLFVFSFFILPYATKQAHTHLTMKRKYFDCVALHVCARAIVWCAFQMIRFTMSAPTQLN